LQVVICLWATMKVTGTDLFDVIGWLIGGLTSLALAVASGYLGWISFVGSLNLAKAAITALWGLMLAHPIGALVTVLGLGAAAWLTFRQSTEETAKSLADLRTKTQGQIEEIGKVRAAMAAAKPGSDAYNAAAKRLAELIPGMNLSLDAHGIVIARLGDGYADNASKADAYVKSLRDIDTAALAQQLALSYDAWQANSRAVADHTQRLKENYGIGQESSTWFQQAQLAVGRWTGEITRANQEGLKLNAALDLNQGQFKQLAEAVLQGAVSIEEITAALRRQGESETAIRGVETALRQMIEAAAQAGPKLSAAQQAAVLAGRNAAASLREAAGAVGTALTDLNKQIDEQQRKLSSAVQAESADWKALGEVAKGTYDGALAEVDRYAAARQAAIVTSGASERTQAAQLIALERETASARLAALQQYQATALGLIDAEGQRRVEVAQRTGGDAAAVEVAVLTAKRTALQQIEGEYRRHIDTLNTEAQRHLGEVRRIEDEIKALKLSTEDRIRELQRGGMTDYEAYQDRKRQAAEKASEAERAVATGDFALAQSLAKQSADLWAQNARAVTDGDKEVISSKQATTAAVQGVGQAAEIEARALQGLADSHKRQAASATTAAGQTEQALQGVATQLEQINQQLGRELRLKLEVDQTAVDALVKDLEQKLTSQTFLLKTQADLTQLATDIDKARKDIAANPAPLQILTDEAQTKIQGLKDALATLPLGDKSAAELALDVDKALKALETVETRLRALQQPLEARHTVASNVAEIQAQIDQLQVNTSSTHTVYVTTVQKKASGGLIQRFAAGGPVFRAPNWRLVPGLGNSDSVPAALASGSFVLRKTAATYYGSLLDRLSDGARRLAGPLVPALLTPGERIISPGTVGRYGAGLFAALNQLQVPRERLAALVDGLAGPVARFAAGGIVGGPSGALIGGGSVRTDTVNINLTIGAQTIPLQGAREQVGRLTSALRELRRGL
jgi:hypothetical protein